MVTRDIQQNRNEMWCVGGSVGRDVDVRIRVITELRGKSRVAEFSDFAWGLGVKGKKKKCGRLGERSGKITREGGSDRKKQKRKRSSQYHDYDAE